jgi:hypothetical protein
MSYQDEHVLFVEQEGPRSAVQIKAFADTWRWDQAAEGYVSISIYLGPGQRS